MISSDFKKLVASRFLFMFAVQIQAVLLGWQMYALTKSALYLGLIGLAEAVPALGLALYAGYIVDHGRPLVIFKRVLQITFVSSILMFCVHLPPLAELPNVQIGMLFGCSFLTGLARSFSQPSIFAVIPRIVSRDVLPKALAWMSSALHVARISGPAVGGILFGLVNSFFTSGITCVVLILSLIIASKMEAVIPQSQMPSEKHSFKHELFAGARYVFKHPILFPALSLDMISVLFGGVTALLPIYAAEILVVGPLGLGLLRAAPAMGAVFVSLSLTKFAIKHQAGKLLFGAVTGFGICILVFALSESLWLSMLSLALSGSFDAVSMIIRSTAVQLASPDSMRGRISAVNSIFIGSSNELGEFESGGIASLIGPVGAAVFGAAACLLTVGLIALLCPALRKLDLSKVEVVV